MMNKSTEKYANTASENAKVTEVEKAVQKAKIDMVTQSVQQIPSPVLTCSNGDCDQTPHPEFLNEFANFRSLTNQTSDGMYPDMVDMVNEMYLGNNTSEARGFQGKQIKDVFAELTQGIGKQDLKCVRAPVLESPLFPQGEQQDISPYDEMTGYHTVI
jgi:hypothetical protein